MENKEIVINPPNINGNPMHEKSIQLLKELLKKDVIMKSLHDTSTERDFKDRRPSFAINAAYEIETKREEVEAYGDVYEFEKHPVVSEEKCYKCDKNIVYQFIDGQVIVKDNTPCFVEEDQVYKIEVPSGVLIFADFFENSHRQVLDHIENEYLNINYLRERQKMTSRYAEFNIGQLFVGNSNPSIHQSGNTILIGELLDKPKMTNELYGFENKGRVITDVWSVVIADVSVYKELVEEYIKRTPELNENFDTLSERHEYYNEGAIESADVKLNVEPGTYELTVYKNNIDNFKAKLVKI